MRKKKNPISILWQVLQNVGAIIAFSSMAQTWASDLFTWKGFLIVVFASYRSYIEPISNFIFGWLPFEIWKWLGDYILLGIIIYVAYVKATFAVFKRKWDKKLIMINLVKVIQGSWLILIWPLIMLDCFIYLSGIYHYFHFKYSNKNNPSRLSKKYPNRLARGNIGLQSKSYDIGKFVIADIKKPRKLFYTRELYMLQLIGATILGCVVLISINSTL